jgi:hypothetical protein
MTVESMPHWRPGPVAPVAVITRLSSVVPLPLDWLWPGYVPAGMTTLLDGDPGLGKSLLTLDLAARVTCGAPMPGEPAGTVHAPRGVVLLSAEDDPARTIRPRLDAAGADPHLVAIVGIREADGTTREPAISAADLAAVEAAIREVDAALLLVDPLMAYLPDTVNANRDQDVRRSLALLADLGQRTGVAVLAIRHLRKTGAENPLYRGGGSIGIIGAARGGLLVARDPDDPSGERRVLAVNKSNLGPMTGSLAFGVVVAPGATQPTVAWQGDSAHRVSDLLEPAADRGARGARDEAMEFLRDVLADGPVAADTVKTAAMAAGITRHTLERAKADLHVRSVRPNGFTGPWSWALPTPYIATEVRTSPGENGGDVPDQLAMYGASAVGDDSLPPAGETGAGWRCGADHGAGHVPARRPDGSLYCGTCHP